MKNRAPQTATIQDLKKHVSAEFARTYPGVSLTEPMTGRILMELAFHLVVGLSGVMLYFIHPSLWTLLGGLALWAIGGAGVATNNHSASHFAASRKLWVNQALTYFGYTFFHQMSTTWWLEKHCRVHHQAPNLLGWDWDIDLAPYFAIHDRELARVGGLKRFFYRHQLLALPLAISGNFIQFVLSGWLYLIPRLLSAKKRTRAHWIDLLCLILHNLFWLVLPSFFFPVSVVLTFYLARSVLAGWVMFSIFAPGHLGVDSAILDQDLKNMDFISRQVLTTANFKTRGLGALVCAGLEYQIEHHLFPSLSHPRYKQIAPIVERYLLERGYPYQNLSWFESMRQVLLAFHRPRPVLLTLEGQTG